MIPSLVKRYRALRNEISSIARANGRNPDEIALMAVTKNRPWNEILPLYEEGHRSFGENRLQSSLEKISEAPNDCEWHFIGPLQKNKARKIVANFSWIHSVDSLETARVISKYAAEASKTSRILLQVNTSGETTKQGMTYEECLDCSEEILMLPNISVEGTMTMAPLTDSTDTILSCFRNLRLLRNELRKRYGKDAFPHLSMGMSHDYPQAIAEGATLLRIGSALFNPNVSVKFSHIDKPASELEDKSDLREDNSRSY